MRETEQAREALETGERSVAFVFSAKRSVRKVDASRKGHIVLMLGANRRIPVSYTHLDVYKRQGLGRLGDLGLVEREGADGGMRADVGALVALDALCLLYTSRCV